MKRLKAACAVLCIVSPLVAVQLKVDVQLVNVVATVTDGRGRYVPYLTADDFVVREDGEIQKISRLSQSTDLPVSMGIVLDASGSMERKMSTAINAVDRFIRSIHRDDDIFLLTFATRPQLLQELTHDRNRLASALRRVTVGGETALYDAVEIALRELRDGEHLKKAILVITDGQDTASSASLNEVLLTIRESEMLVYSLGISSSDATQSGPVRIPIDPPIIIAEPSGRPNPSPFPIPFPTGPGVPGIPVPGGPRVPGGTRIPGIPWASSAQRQRLPGGGTITVGDSVDMNVLDSLAEASGGNAWLLSQSWMASRGSEINTILDELALELRSQYSIDYYPNHPIKDGKWHHIEITAMNPEFHVRARKEYFGR